jgi:hypothetical protein
LGNGESASIQPKEKDKVKWKEYAKQHIPALIVAAVIVFGGRLWLLDHDARLKAEASVKQAEANVQALQAQQKTVTKAVTAKLVVLHDKAVSVDTPQKAITATAETAPELDATALPDTERVSVKAEPLYQDLNEAAQNKVKLDGCEDSLNLQKQITAEKDKEAIAERKKPTFLHRLGKAAKVVGCAGAGGLLGGFSKQPGGAGIGAAAGAAVCQMF